ncbi:MAG: hypothetical protein IKN71_01940 [Alphaproteobacteria bacterium]|nr:hypothetical protein [Alphaproteobacteria bacterium]
MTKILSKSTCDDCGKEFDSTENSCPKCGSKNITKHICFTENVPLNIRDRVKAKAKDDTLPSKKKVVFEYRQGFEESQSTESGYVQKERLIDHINDKYKEVVADEDGKVIHHCEESLSKHQGHGSAKKSNDNSHKPD